MQRYFAWKEDGYWQGHKLLTSSQISILLSHLPQDREVFASVQSHDETGEILSCPLYADFDHKSESLERTQADVQTFVWRIITELGVVPEIYYSGRKGFHVILPYEIIHRRCHYVAQHVARRFGGDLASFDHQVYRPRAMFRLPLSMGSQPGFYKVRLTREELFNASVEDIQRFSKARRQLKTNETDLEKLQSDVFLDMLEEAAESLPPEKVGKAVYGQSAYLTPCLKDMLQNGTGEGLRNKAVFVLSKFFKQAGLSEDQAREELLSRAHFKAWEIARGVNVTGVLRSVYKSPREPRLGCKYGMDADVMQAHCQRLCPFNPEFPLLKVK